MGKFNRALVFSTPFIIYALGLWGSRQALIGTIVYMLWVFIGLDEAEYRSKKPVGRDWLMGHFIQLAKNSFIIVLFLVIPLSLTFIFREPLIIALVALGIAILQIAFEE